MSERELRTAAQPMEIREDEGDAIRVSGYAAVFGEETNIGGMFTEVIDRGAFANALQRQDDVVFLVNHDGLPLARTRSGTLKLTEDEPRPVYGNRTGRHRSRCARNRSKDEARRPGQNVVCFCAEAAENGTTAAKSQSAQSKT